MQAAIAFGASAVLWIGGLSVASAIIDYQPPPVLTPADRVAEFERLCGPALELAPTIAAECAPCGDRLCCQKPAKIGEERGGYFDFSCNAKGCDRGWPGESVR
jgi:hypothetical protein